ncbi:MAG TPA: tripartite tricarboxylate transporter substrate binding protein [Herbaspirillum sp.]|jgi:tripartite-type tricarboxylate transporter receptor subunit TctC
MRKQTFFFGMAIALLLCAAVPAQAQLSGKPLRLIVAYPPGGSPDSLARILAQQMSEDMGHPVVVENRPGANGAVANAVVKNAEPDGYTLVMMSSAAYSIGPNLQKNMPNPVKDFAPVALAATSPIFLVTNPAQAKTFNEFIALAKAKPGLPYGSSGIGTGHHIAMELLKAKAGIDLTHVPYKGVAQTVPAVLSGEIAATFTGLNVVLPFVKNGRLKILAVATSKRSAMAPDVPTIAELGIPGYDVSISLGLLAPLKTPPEIVKKMNAEIIKAINAPGVREKLFRLGVEPASSTPEQFGELIAKEIQDYSKLIALTGAKPE